MIIKNGQSRKTGYIEYARRRKTKQNHNTICVGHHYTQANTSNVKKDISSPTNNWGYRRVEHSFYAEIATDITTQNSQRKDTNDRYRY